MYPIKAYIKIIDNKLISFDKSYDVTILEIDGKKYINDEFYIYPGFRDCHGHIYGLGKMLLGIDLSKAKSFEECIDIIINNKDEKCSWIIGRGWNNENWDNKEFPNKKILDRYFPDNPVYLVRIDGHCALANSLALEIGNITSETVNPDGGEILKDINNLPSGILIDNAMNLVSNHIPKPNRANRSKYIRKGMEELAKFGIIETHDMDVHPELLEIFQDLDNEDNLKQYIKAFVSGQEDEYIKYNIKRYKGKSFEIAGVKLYLDGALGSKGALLRKSYSDDINHLGLKLLSLKKLKSKIKNAIENNFDIAIHCIGDYANSMAISAFKTMQDVKGQLEFRIEHAQILNKDLPRKFKQYNITASIQPIHCVSDAKMAEKRLGERIKHSYLWKTLLNNGVNVIPGSDYPIESANPLLGIDAFINRRPISEQNSWQAKEVINLNTALNLYYSTLSIQDLKNNFIILNKNLSKIKSHEIRFASNLLTVFKGKVTYNNFNNY